MPKANLLQLQPRRIVLIKPSALGAVLHGLPRSGLMTWGTGAPCRIGLTSAREGARWFYTHQTPDERETQHAVDRCWSVVEALGGGDLPKTFRLAIGDEERRWAEQLLHD